MHEPNIQLHIERLVLDGLTIAPSQRQTVQAALETELTRLIAESGLSSQLLSGGRLPSLVAGPLNLPQETNPTQLGQQIARSLYGGIGQ